MGSIVVLSYIKKMRSGAVGYSVVSGLVKEVLGYLIVNGIMITVEYFSIWRPYGNLTSKYSE